MSRVFKARESGLLVASALGDGIIGRMVMRRWRIIFALVILVISLAALVWSFLPGARIIRRQKIQPTEMQLPNPTGVLTPARSLAGLEMKNEAARTFRGADRFVLLI